MATYKFEWLNNGVEIINPTLYINPIVEKVNPIAMTIDVNITLENESCKVGLLLEGVLVQNLNYDAKTLTDRVLTKLDQYKISE